MNTPNLLCTDLNEQKFDDLRSMDRIDNSIDNADMANGNIRETVSLDLSQNARLNVSTEDTKQNKAADNTASKPPIAVDIATSMADKNRNFLIDTALSHGDRPGVSNSADKRPLHHDENDSSVSSISSGEGEHGHQNSGDPDHLRPVNAEDHHTITCDDDALASKREYNRQNAARARKRAKTQLQNLQQQVQALNMNIAQLKERNIALQQTVQTLKEQNALLAQNQGSVDGSNVASSATNIAPSLFPATTPTDSTQLQSTLLQLLLATATAPSPNSQTQQSQSSLSIQQQTLYYWLLSQVLQQYQPSQTNNILQQIQLQAPSPVQPIQMHSTPAMNTSDQLMALLLAHSQAQNGTASGYSNPDNNNDAKSQSLFYSTSRDAQPPPK